MKVRVVERIERGAGRKLGLGAERVVVTAEGKFPPLVESGAPAGGHEIAPRDPPFERPAGIPVGAVIERTAARDFGDYVLCGRSVVSRANLASGG